MEQAIKKAIEGGYVFIKGSTKEQVGYIIKVNLEHKEVVLLNPLFWQCLGRAEGWTDSMPSTYDFNDDIPEWQHNWHSFIDHLASGKDIDSFFTNLLK